MAKTATVRARIEPDLKLRAEQVFSALGLNATEAIRLFYRQVELRNGLPFSLEIPNELTAQILDATDGGRDVVTCEDAEELFSKLGI